MTTADRAEYCPRCGEPIKQPKQGGRPRQFCTKVSCRKAENRLKKRLESQQREQEQKEVLEQTWQQFDRETQEYLRTVLENEGLDAATRATNLILHILSKERAEQSRQEDTSPGQGVRSKRTLTGASLGDLMQVTAAGLEALSDKTPRERDMFVARYSLALGRLYAALVPYLIEDSNTREKSLRLSQTYQTR